MDFDREGCNHIVDDISVHRVDQVLRSLFFFYDREIISIKYTKNEFVFFDIQLIDLITTNLI